jgi:hypothetical protein
MGTEIRKILILGDTHFPFVDRRAYELILKIGLDVGVNELIIAGDFVDFYQISKYDKSPLVKYTFEEEVQCGAEELEILYHLFLNAKKTYIVSNHENRLPTFLTRKAPQIFSLLDVIRLLRLNELGYKVIDYDPCQALLITPDLIIRHEPPPGQITTRLGKAMCSVIHAHEHRSYHWPAKGLNGKDYRLQGISWLGDKNEVATKYTKFVPQWTLGALLLRIENNETFFQDMVINTSNLRYSCELDGKIYTN